MIDNLRAFYEENGIDYDSFLRRLLGKERLVHKYLELFLADATYSELTQAVQKRDYDVVLSKAHTLKGVALNIELRYLSECSADIVTSIRAGKPEEIDEIFSKLQQEYEKIIARLNA